MRIIIQNLIAHPEDWNLTGFRRLRPEVLLASQALVLWSKKLVSVSLNFKVLIYQSYIVVSHKKKKDFLQLSSVGTPQQVKSFICRSGDAAVD